VHVRHYVVCLDIAVELVDIMREVRKAIKVGRRDDLLFTVVQEIQHFLARFPHKRLQIMNEADEQRLDYLQKTVPLIQNGREDRIPEILDVLDERYVQVLDEHVVFLDQFLDYVRHLRYRIAPQYGSDDLGDFVVRVLDGLDQPEQRISQSLAGFSHDLPDLVQDVGQRLDVTTQGQFIDNVHAEGDNVLDVEVIGVIGVVQIHFEVVEVLLECLEIAKEKERERKKRG